MGRIGISRKADSDARPDREFPSEKGRQQRDESGAGCSVDGVDVAKWAVASAADQSAKETTALRGATAPGREIRETSTAQPAYRKLYRA